MLDGRRPGHTSHEALALCQGLKRWPFPLGWRLNARTLFQIEHGVVAKQR
jgi:hypothetical protein